MSNGSYPLLLFQNRNLVYEMLQTAKYPQRIRFGIVDQIEEESESCNPNHIVDCSVFTDDPTDKKDSLDSPLSPKMTSSLPSVVVAASLRSNANDHDQGAVRTEWKSHAMKPEPPLSCKYSHQFDTFTVKPDMAMGTVFTRHLVARMYRGEYYALMMDAHATISRDWDVELIQQLESTENEMAIMTTRPVTKTTDSKNNKHGRRALSSLADNNTVFGDKPSTDEIQDSSKNGGNKKDGDSRPPDAFHKDPRIVICDADFVGDNEQSGSSSKTLRLLEEQSEGFPTIHGKPQLQPYWTPDFSFSRGHFLLKVKPDPYLSTVYMNEDVSVSIRAFTHGYDFYAPERPVAFYSDDDTANDPSSRRGRFYLDKLEKDKGTGKSSLDRLYGIVKLNPHTPLNSWSHKEEEKYGLGKTRDYSKFFSTFGIHAQERVIEKHLCNFVTSGAMHNMFHEHLRSDGMGIDYGLIYFRFHELYNVRNPC
jgi:hypothetical protein